MVTEKKQDWYVYILKCADGSLYTGITNDIEKRMKAHREGKGSKYVRAKLPFEVVYKEKCSDRITASKREYQIKELSRTEKVELINKFLP